MTRQRSGVPVLLLHGQPGSPKQWEPVLPHLSGLEVVNPVRPGYDGTPPGGFWHNAHAMTRVLDQAGVDRAVVVGYSWGGGPALAMALAHPDRVASLALVAPVGVSSCLHRNDRLLARRLPSLVTAAVMRRAEPWTIELMSRNVGSPLVAEQKRLVVDEMATRDTRAAWRSWRVEQRAMIDETPGLERRLGEITVPATLLAGRRDSEVPTASVRELAERLGGDTHYTDVDAGHLLLLEQPAAVAATIQHAAERARDLV